MAKWQVQEDRLNKLEREMRALKSQNRKLRAEVEILRKREAKYELNKEVMNEELFAQGFESFEEVVNMSWLDSLYRTAETLIGSPLQAGKVVDLLVLEDKREGFKGNEGIWRTVTEIHPDLNNVEEAIRAIVVTTKIMGSGEASDKWFIKTEVTDVGREWFGTLERVREKKDASYIPPRR